MVLGLPTVETSHSHQLHIFCSRIGNVQPSIQCGPYGAPLLILLSSLVLRHCVQLLVKYIRNSEKARGTPSKSYDVKVDFCARPIDKGSPSSLYLLA